MKDQLRSALSTEKSPRPYKIADLALTIRMISPAERDCLERQRMLYRFKDDEQGVRMTDMDINFNQFRARHVAVFLGDADGNRIYSDKELQEIDREWPAHIADEVMELGLAHNKMDSMAAARKKKSCSSDQNGRSGSSSPGASDCPVLKPPKS